MYANQFGFMASSFELYFYDAQFRKEPKSCIQNVKCESLGFNKGMEMDQKRAVKYFYMREGWREIERESGIV